jgi:hypothetical protein
MTRRCIVCGTTRVLDGRFLIGDDDRTARAVVTLTGGHRVLPCPVCQPHEWVVGTLLVQLAELRTEDAS